MAKAKWTSSGPNVSVDAAGTLRVSIPIKDNGVNAVIVAFALTADHGLRVDVTSAPGANGLTSFEAWSNR